MLYPFSAVVGQDELKLALILNVINPAIGGVLIRGEKGTAKSTAVRSLASIVPHIKVFKGCRFNCDPDVPSEWCSTCRREKREVVKRPINIVNLPLSATEDRLIGSVDFESAIKSGTMVFQLGIFARVHRGVLYVDEVNLLDDHLVDILLRVAGDGVNVVEREGMSVAHPSRFVLIGSMNPEEGELRPHFMDRFGLCVEVVSEKDPAVRVEIMKRRELFDRCPDELLIANSKADEELRARIENARSLLPFCEVPLSVRSLIGELCSEHGVEGHRAELVMERAAKALAVWEGRVRVGLSDVERVRAMVLRHRAKSVKPPSSPRGPERNNRDDERDGSTGGEDERAYGERERQGGLSGDSESGTGHKEMADDGRAGDSYEKGPSGGGEKVFRIGSVFEVKEFASEKDRLVRCGGGRRSISIVKGRRGRYVRASYGRTIGDVALDATIRAAAPYQARRRARKVSTGCRIVLNPEDIRIKVREGRVGNLIVFLIDASGSMGARGRMMASKGAVMSLLLSAYQKRDKVAMISFRRDSAVVNLPPTSSVERAGKLLAELPVGGKTPLTAGLLKTHDLLKAQVSRSPGVRPIVFVITDGRANVPFFDGRSPFEEALSVARMMASDGRVEFVVIDTEDRSVMVLGLARHLAAALNARYFRIEELKADDLVKIVKDMVL